MAIKFKGGAPSLATHVKVQGTDYSNALDTPKPAGMKTKSVAGNIIQSKTFTDLNPATGESEKTTVDTADEVQVSTGWLVSPTPAEVGVELSRTIQPQPYTSLRIQVSLKVPCENTPDDIEKAYDFATTWASNKLNEAFQQATGAKKN